ncbi:MAG TPA: hypothetical protein VIT23_18000, partial [Terrimicrobiaceae bacterium]
NVKSTDPNHAKAKSYAHEMINDQNTMLKGLMELRTDTYPTKEMYASVRPANYRELISMPSDKVAFIYASKRYMIPFGWFANPLPSTTASSWAIMLHYNFNPFNPTGTYEALLKP